MLRESMCNELTGETAYRVRGHMWARLSRVQVLIGRSWKHLNEDPRRGVADVSPLSNPATIVGCKRRPCCTPVPAPVCDPCIARGSTDVVD